ncbi:MAG: cation:proton antiporter [Planctomycetales bacterium]|nr:cation:proton antiporter [Planctomycetales bacterium]NIM08866.1 cation:proton antiporter [Planctomycetales bacterium]NIN08326.1 cation:proton antiporter [Planctomycetales bacterium]NIN77454.1 cation:proton antiporter [Planctomycetales bacterium]NIO34626.1 cation:proton antiporter [Planctomycetales bacterium]
MIYALCFILILIGLYGVLTRRNTVKIIISLLVIEYGVHLFLVLQGYRRDGVPPIIEPGGEEALWLQRSVDPLPQALVLTSIVIGLGVLALMVALSIRLYERFGTFDIREMRKLRG